MYGVNYWMSNSIGLESYLRTKNVAKGVAKQKIDVKLAKCERFFVKKHKILTTFASSL